MVINMKSKSNFKCKECGYTTSKWLGKCPKCNTWNSFEEVIIKNVSQSGGGKDNEFLNKAVEYSSNNVTKVLTLEEYLKINYDTGHIYPFSSLELNDFWNKGIKGDALTLISGEPGLGKSTFALQLLRSLYVANSKTIPNYKLLYITAEESVLELARRSQRLGINKEILMTQCSDFDSIENILLEYKPHLTIIDSIQTIFSPSISSSPGSVSQVSTLTNQFLAITKSIGISIILVGHVTKDGQIAGPKTLEHMVDSVLLLEKADSMNYRTLTFTKHRFGTTENLLLLQMQEDGLKVVTDPSLALLENVENGVGISYGIAMDKNLPFVVELQALVSSPVFNGNGRREVIGTKAAKLNIILAIAEKYLGISLKDRDVYLQITGTPKIISDDSLDLPILLSILSSFYGKPLNQIINEKNEKLKMVFAGRLTFSGNLRVPTNEEKRNLIATKLGFKYNISIKYGKLRETISSIGKSDN
jgi:DNA repair protein RadA/Sms